MHRGGRDVMRPQKYANSLLHFLQVPLDSYSTYSLRFDVGGSSSPLSYCVATIVIKIFIHTNHTSTNVFIKKRNHFILKPTKQIYPSIATCSTASLKIFVALSISSSETMRAGMNRIVSKHDVVRIKRF
jgi:hypothetical protein